MTEKVNPVQHFSDVILLFLSERRKFDISETKRFHFKINKSKILQKHEKVCDLSEHFCIVFSSDVQLYALFFIIIDHIQYYRPWYIMMLLQGKLELASLSPRLVKILM